MKLESKRGENMPKKPGKDHPWKNTASAAAVSWARQEARIPNIQTVRTARSENLSNKDSKKLEGGLK